MDDKRFSTKCQLSFFTIFYSHVYWFFSSSHKNHQSEHIPTITEKRNFFKHSLISPKNTLKLLRFYSRYPFFFILNSWQILHVLRLLKVYCPLKIISLFGGSFMKEKLMHNVKIVTWPFICTYRQEKNITKTTKYKKTIQSPHMRYRYKTEY